MEIAGKFRPVFTRKNGSWQPTQQWKDVQAIMQRNTDIPINVQAAPSVLTGITGQGIWGTGGGVYRPDFGDAYVDPIQGSVTTAAHEAAHQAFPSQLINDPIAKAKNLENLQLDYEKNNLINDGTALRVGYEAFSKPIMLEEANAQGVATAAMNAVGLQPDPKGWPNMYAYPGQYRFGGMFDRAMPIYKQAFNKPGLATLVPGEIKAVDVIKESYMPAIQRQFQKGYQGIQ